MKNILVLGSTGSIGQQTLDVVRAFPDELNLIGLAAGNNIALLEEQIREFRPGYYYSEKSYIPDNKSVRYCSLEDMVCIEEVDLVMVSTAGSVGLIPTLKALQHKKQVALSNKEPIVMAGHLIKQYESEFGGTLLPVDSEPSAIWQCLQGEQSKVRRLIITASGGPFRKTPKDQLYKVTPSDALNHPTWSMGPKITIDSSTMMNKAFEVIESKWLFNMEWNDITVMIHPQSTVHSMVEFIDGSVKAQMGPPNMRLPIQYALFYPHRKSNSQIPRLPTDNAYNLEFEPLNAKDYPCFELALDYAKKGGTFPTVISAVDEIAVEAFLDGKIRYTQIPQLLEQVLSAHTNQSNPTLEDILATEVWATTKAQELVLA